MKNKLIKNFNYSTEKLESIYALRNLKPDSSGGYTIKNIGLTDLPMFYPLDNKWAAITKEELALSYKSWIGKPIFATKLHPNGDTVTDNTKDSKPIGSIIDAELSGDTVVLTYYVFDEDGINFIKNGAVFTSTCYGCEEIPCYYKVSNGDRKLNTDEDSVTVTRKHVGLVPLHVLFTKDPRAGLITLIRTNAGKKMEELLAEMIGKLDEICTSQEKMMNALSELIADQPIENIDSEREKDPVANTTEPDPEPNTIDLEKLASLLSEQLVAKNVQTPNGEKSTSLAQMFSERHKNK